jgi:hypothetical protein
MWSERLLDPPEARRGAPARLQQRGVGSRVEEQAAKVLVAVVQPDEPNRQRQQLRCQGACGAQDPRRLAGDPAQ